MSDEKQPQKSDDSLKLTNETLASAQPDQNDLLAVSEGIAAGHEFVTANRDALEAKSSEKARQRMSWADVGWEVAGSPVRGLWNLAADLDSSLPGEPYFERDEALSRLGGFTAGAFEWGVAAAPFYRAASIGAKAMGAGRTVTWLAKSLGGGIGGNLVTQDKTFASVLVDSFDTPLLDNFLTRALYIDPDDRWFTKKLKIAAEGAGLGLLGDAAAEVASIFLKSAGRRLFRGEPIVLTPDMLASAVEAAKPLQKFQQLRQQALAAASNLDEDEVDTALGIFLLTARSGRKADGSEYTAQEVLDHLEQILRIDKETGFTPEQLADAGADPAAVRFVQSLRDKSDMAQVGGTPAMEIPPTGPTLDPEQAAIEAASKQKAAEVAAEAPRPKAEAPAKPTEPNAPADMTPTLYGSGDERWYGQALIQRASALVGLTEDASFGTLMHELFHVGRAFFYGPGSELDKVLRAAVGLADGVKWTAEAEEAAVGLWLRWLQSGDMPMPALQTAFQQIKAWMDASYDALDQMSPDMAPAVREGFEALIGLHPGREMGNVGQPTFVPGNSLLGSTVAEPQSVLPRNAAILTGDNPRFPSVPGGTAALTAAIKAMGGRIRRAVGKYDTVESSIVVEGLSREQVMELGQKYGQESVIYDGNLIYTNGPNAGKQRVNRGTQVFDAEPENFYTTITDEDGATTHFSNDYDWDSEPVLLGQANEPYWVHYSRADSAKLLTEGLRKRYAGTGAVGEEGQYLDKSNPDETGVIHLYSPNGRTEAQVTQSSRSTVFVRPEGLRLLDFTSDEGQSVIRAIKKETGESSLGSRPLLLREQLRKRGYNGIYDPRMGRAQIYDDIPASHLSNERPRGNATGFVGQGASAKGLQVSGIGSLASKGKVGVLAKAMGLKPESTRSDVDFVRRLVEVAGKVKLPKNVRDIAKVLVGDTEAIIGKDGIRTYGEFYGAEMAAERAALGAKFPSIVTDEPLWVAYNALHGAASPQTPLKRNVKEGIDALDYILSDQPLTHEAIQSAVKFVGTTAPGKRAQAIFIGNLYRSSPEALHKLFSTNLSQDEFRARRIQLGFKPTIDPNVLAVVKAATGQVDLIPGPFLFGPKVGSYIANRLGRHEFTTMDLWETLISNLYLGKAVIGKAKDPKTGKAVDAVIKTPAGPEDRLAIGELSNHFADVAGMTPADGQAARWYAGKKVAANIGYTRGGDLETSYELVKQYLSPETVAGGRAGMGGVGAGAGQGTGAANAASGRSPILNSRASREAGIRNLAAKASAAVRDAHRAGLKPDEAAEVGLRMVNIRRLNTTDDVKAGLQTLSKEMEDLLLKEIPSKAQSVTKAEAEALAATAGLGDDQIKFLQKQAGKVKNLATRATAVRSVHLRMMEELMAAMKRAALDPTKLPAYRRELQRAMQATLWRQETAAEIGRALNSFNIVADPALSEAQYAAKVLANLSAASDAGVTPLQQRQAMLALSTAQNPKQLLKMLRHMGQQTEGRSSFWDVINEIRYGAMLSGLSTQTWNVVSQAGMTVIQPLFQMAGGRVREGARAYLNLLGAITDTFTMTEAGLRLNDQSAIANAAKAWWRETPILDRATGTLEKFKAITPEKLGVTNPLLANAVRGAGIFVRIPSRFLTSADEFFKQINYRAYLRDEALDDGIRRGLAGDRLAQFVDDYVSGGFAPDGEGLAKTPINMARKATFTSDLEDGLGKLLQDAAAKHPWLRLVVPFVRVPTNIIKFVGSTNPVIAPLMKNFRREFMSPDPIIRADARGRLALGSMVWLMAGTAAAAGLVTGGGPQDPKLKAMMRETGWQPYSIKVGDKYIDYSRIEPLATIFGIAADVNEVLADTDDETANTTAIVMTAGLFKNISNKTYLRGLFSALKVPFDFEKEGPKWFGQLAGSFVPNIAQQAMPDDELSLVRSWVDDVRRKVPGWRDGLPARRNLLGEIVRPTPGWPVNASPLKVSAEKGDMVASELAKLQYAFSPPPRRWNGIDLASIRNGKQDAYDYWTEQIGVVRIGGFTLREALMKLFTSKQYKAMPAPSDDETDQFNPRVKAVREVMGRYRQAALAKTLAQYPELKQQKANIDRLKLGGSGIPSKAQNLAALLKNG